MKISSLILSAGSALYQKVSSNPIVVTVALAALSALAVLAHRVYKKYKASKLLDEAIQLTIANQLEKADRCLKKALLWGNQEKILERYLAALEQQNRWVHLQAKVEESFPPRSTEVQRLYGLALCMQGKYEQALLNPLPINLKIQALQQFSSRLLSEKKWNEAQIYLSQLVLIKPAARVDGKQVELLYVKALMEQNECEQAEEFLARKLTRDREAFYENSAYGALYGILLLNKEKGEEAYQVYSNTLQRHPECTHLLIYQAEAQALANQPYDERHAPLQDFYTAISSEIYTNRCLQLKNAAILSKMAEVRLEMFPDVARLYDNITHLLTNAVEETFQEDFQEGELDPLWKAMALRTMGEPERAEEELQKILSLHPHHIYATREMMHLKVSVFLNNAVKKFQEGQHEEAEINIQGALMLKETPILLKNAAELYFQMQKWDRLNEMIVKLMDIEPEAKINGLSLHALQALSNLKEGKFEEGREKLHAIYENQPEEFFSSCLSETYSWINLYHFKENQEETLQILQKAYQQNQSLDILTMQIEAMMQLKRPYDEIIQLINETNILCTHPIYCSACNLDHLTHYFRLKLAYGQSAEEARGVLRDVVAHFRAVDPTAKFAKAKALKALGEIAEAKRLLEEAVLEADDFMFREELRIINEIMV
ncbi:MAG: hypothetical protein LW832_10975 [Parachlamydia sp.]|nr:hypothetical protein [Parachlamydia sp.]